MGNKGYSLVDDNGNLVGTQAYYGEIVISGGSEFTIDGVNQWHMINTYTESDFSGATFSAGLTGAITAFADGGGGKVVVTSAGHGVADGGSVSITGTTNYNGLFVVSSSLTNTFEITDTWVSDDATGTFRHGAHIEVPAAGDGDYFYSWCMSVTAAANNKVYEVSVTLDGATNGIARRKIATGADVGQMACSGLVLVSSGQEIGIAVRNITDATNITIAESSLSAFRIGA